MSDRPYSVVRLAMHRLAPLAAATTLALLCAACTAPSSGPGPVVTAPPPVALPSPAPVALPSSAPAPAAFPVALAARSRSSQPSRRPALEEVAGHASGIYLARVERQPGVTLYIVTEIWRADPGLPVAVGDVIQRNPEKPDRPLPPVGDQLIVYIFSPHLVRPDGTRVSRGSANIYDGHVPAYGLTVAEARDRLR